MSRQRQGFVGSGSRQGQDGYTLVVLAVAITVLGILLAMALPSWKSLIQREREQELIFRGIQYAEAIRIFQAKFGRLPIRLEELLEAKPRSLRQLWPDPMTEDGQWGLIFATAGGRPGQPGPGGQPQQGRGLNNGRPTPFQSGGQGNDGSLSVPGRGPNGERQVTVGPINGVYSTSEDEGFLTFFGTSVYSEWKFTPDIFRFQATAGAVGVGQNGGGLPPLIPIQFVGRPFPAGVMPQNNGAPGQGLINGSGPNGRPLNPESPRVRFDKPPDDDEGDN